MIAAPVEIGGANLYAISIIQAQLLLPSYQKNAVRSMLSNLLIVIAFGMGTAALLDIFLYPQQKAWVESRLVQTWSLLENLKRHSLTSLLRRPGAPKLLMALTMVTPFLFIAIAIMRSEPNAGGATGYAQGDADEYFKKLLTWSGGIATFLGFLPALIIMESGETIISWFLNAPTLRDVVVRSTLTLGVVLSTFVAVLIVDPVELQIFLNSQPFWLSTFVTTFCGSFVIASLLLMWFWLFAIVPLLFSYLAMAALYSCEFVVRRIAESTKGPLIAVSLTCAAVAGMIKALQ